MKVSIRLQNHGVKHHPHWWIVIAPNRKNMKGRILEHVGYWCPNGRSQEIRSAILNLSRIKYWMGCGAVPTFRVHRLLHEFGYLPKPWFYVSMILLM
jgi:small subunit ribosomal protein S16